MFINILLVSGKEHIRNRKVFISNYHLILIFRIL